MYQFSWLILKDRVLHQLYIHNDMEYHQLVLPQRYHKRVLQSLHNDLGHQGIDRTLELLRKRVYWSTMTQDANTWVTECRRCQVMKGDYNTPKLKIGHLIAHNPLDLVCLDFTKVDPSKGGQGKCSGYDWCFHQVQCSRNHQQSKGSHSCQGSGKPLVSCLRKSCTAVMSSHFVEDRDDLWGDNYIDIINIH